MKQGEYIVVKAPPDYPGHTSGGVRRKIYEHHLVWWQNTGTVVPEGYEIHHKNEVKTDNRFDNFELKTKGSHTSHHNKLRRKPDEEIHGTSTGYRRGCRCIPCRLAQRKSYQRWKQRCSSP